MKQVQVVRRDSGMALVEWMGDYDVPQRYWIQESELIGIDGVYQCVEPEQGIPYGVDWSREVSLSITSTDICRELRRRGIWTAADALNNIESVRGALIVAYGVDLAAVINAARQYSKPTMEG